MPRSLILILVGFFALGCLYLFVTPPFEASDELHHYPVVHHIATGRGLPIQELDVTTAWAQEGSQPPAYYALAAAFTFWIDTSDFESVHILNPFTRAGIPGTTHNANYTRAPAELLASPFPPRGTFLAVYLIRLISLLMGVGTITFTYHLAATLFDSHNNNSNDSAKRPFGVSRSTDNSVPLLAAALVAFNPMFLFVSASVNNDNLIWQLASAILYILVRSLYHSNLNAKRQVSSLPSRVCLLHGLLLGLAALTKISGLVLFPIVGLAIVAISLQPTAISGQPLVVSRQSSRAAFIRHSSLIFIPALLIASWWYFRNLNLYGELLGLDRMVAIAGPRPAGFGLADLVLEWRSFWYAYWGLFGSFSILAPQWVYIFFTALTLAALAGLAVLVIRSRSTESATADFVFLLRRFQSPDTWSHFLLLTFIILTYISFVRWTLTTPASQGRLVFTTLAPVSAYLAFGLRTWLSHRLTNGLIIALALIAALTGLSIRPHYLPPASITEAQLPTDLQPIHARLAPGVELIGYQVQPNSNPLDITLYWRAYEPVTTDHNLFLHLLGRDRALIGSLDTWPGGGLRPTSFWNLGEIYPDSYFIEIDDHALTPTTLLLDIAMWSTDPARPYPIMTLSGNPIPSVLLDVGTLDSSQPISVSPTHPTDSTLEYGIQLLGYDLPETLSIAQPADLSLYWQATESIPADFTVFVHVVDSTGTTIAQADGPPANGFWPTSRWKPGYPVLDTHTLTIPSAGNYRLLVGLYDPITVTPLIAFQPDGSEWPDRAIELATVTVK